MASAAILSGCSPVISDTLLSPAERRERSIEHARAAVKAQKSGNLANLKSELDAAVVGIGMPYGLERPYQGGSARPDPDLAEAAGDVVRHYFDRDGQVIEWQGEGRMIGGVAGRMQCGE